MMLIPITLALLVASFLIVLLFPNLGTISFTFLFSLLLIAFSFLYLVRFKFSFYWPVVVEMIFLVFGLNLFWLISTNIWAKLILLIFSLAGISYLLKNLYNLVYAPRFCQPKGFSWSAIFFTFLISFSLFVGLGALNYFFEVSLIKLGIVFFPLLAWLAFYNIWFERPRPSYFLIFIFALLGVECYFVLGFLPLSFYFSSFLVSLFFSFLFILSLQKRKLVPQARPRRGLSPQTNR